MPDDDDDEFMYEYDHDYDYGDNDASVSNINWTPIASHEIDTNSPLTKSLLVNISGDCSADVEIQGDHATNPRYIRAVLHSTKALSDLQKATLKAEWAMTQFGSTADIHLKEEEEAAGNPYFYKGDD